MTFGAGFLFGVLVGAVVLRIAYITLSLRDGLGR